VGEQEDMGWGTLAHHVEPFLPTGGRLEMLGGIGHFAHIEQPDLIVEMVTSCIGTPC
jgi:hypothetical protein